MLIQAATPFSNPTLAIWDTLRCLEILMGWVLVFSLVYRFRASPWSMKWYAIALELFALEASFTGVQRLGHPGLIWQTPVTFVAMGITMYAVYARNRWPIVYAADRHAEEKHGTGA